MAAISCEVRAACRAAVFYKNEKRALSSSCFNADTQSGTPWGEKPILDGFFDIGDSPGVPCLLNLGGIALGMTLDWDFLQCLLVYSEEISNLCISIGNNVRFYPFFKD